MPMMGFFFYHGNFQPALYIEYWYLTWLFSNFIVLRYFSFLQLQWQNLGKNITRLRCISYIYFFNLRLMAHIGSHFVFLSIINISFIYHLFDVSYTWVAHYTPITLIQIRFLHRASGGGGVVVVFVLVDTDRQSPFGILPYICFNSCLGWYHHLLMIFQL